MALKCRTGIGSRVGFESWRSDRSSRFRHFQNALGAERPVELHAEYRGDKTAIELFIAGLRGWEAGLRRRMDDGKANGN